MFPVKPRPPPDPEETVVPVIAVTRLRLKDPALLDEFFVDAVAAIEQAQKSDGNLGANGLADVNNAWWTVSSWRDRDMMRAFVTSEPHQTIMSRLDRYCDEATFVDWVQPGSDLPDWQTSYQRLVADGQVAELTAASPANQTRAFPAPVETR
jgi:quinol monooxygenase YgiN